MKPTTWFPQENIRRAEISESPQRQQNSEQSQLARPKANKLSVSEERNGGETDNQVSNQEHLSIGYFRGAHHKKKLLNAISCRTKQAVRPMCLSSSGERHEGESDSQVPS